MKQLPNRLFVMQAYEEAYKYGEIEKRYGKGHIVIKDGWTPNYIWNDCDTVGSDRRAREVHNNPLYSEYFQTIKRKEYMKKYYPNIGTSIRSNYEYIRIKPYMRFAWTLIVKGQMKLWEK